jgi:hypothetical protein
VTTGGNQSEVNPIALRSVNLRSNMAHTRRLDAHVTSASTSHITKRKGMHMPQEKVSTSDQNDQASGSPPAPDKVTEKGISQNLKFDDASANVMSRGSMGGMNAGKAPGQNSPRTPARG